MDRICYIELLGLVFCLFSSAYAVLEIREIIGPDSIKLDSAEDLVLDCDFDAENEDDVVVKWFFNGTQDQIYQWIAPNELAYALGSLKDLIDPTYRVSDDPNAKLRALRFKEVNSALSGNFTCKVDTNNDVKWLTKQVIVYSPPSSFELILVGGDDEFQGDEVVLCDAMDVFPKPDFDLQISGLNGTDDLPEMFHLVKKETTDGNGNYNVSITLSFNSSYLEPGTTKFECRLSMPGTNYSESKTVEYFVDSATDEPSPIDFFSEDYTSNSTEETITDDGDSATDEPSPIELFSEDYISNSTEETITDDGEIKNNGVPHLHSSLLLVVLLIFPLVWAT